MKLKKILASKFLENILAIIGYLYIKLVYVTSSWKVVYTDHQDMYDIKEPIIYSFWHGRMALMPCFTINKVKINVIISSHGDGKIITRIMKYFGFDIINTKNNNVNAIRSIINKISLKENIAITPDSAKRRGPRMKINGNIISIAKKTGGFILPISYSITRNIISNSWDKFLVPLPFSKGIVIYGKILSIPNLLTEEEEKEYKDILENELNRITFCADEFVNLTPITPK